MAEQAILGDAALIRAKASDAVALGDQIEALAAQHMRMTFRICWSILRNHHDAEDAVQECFLRVLKFQDRLHEIRNPKAWLARIAWTAALDRRSRRSIDEVSLANQDLPGENALELLPDPSLPVEQLVAGKEMQSILERLIAALPDELRQPLELSTIQELNSTEIAEIMNIQAAAPAYKLAFAIYELQGGKKINERDYSLLLRADNNSNKLKIGTRVPIDVGEGKITYADVGFDMDCSAVETVDGKVSVRLDTTITNFALPEQNTDPRTAGSRPVLRGVTQRVHSILSPGKAQVVTSMDVNSTKRMQVEVTATKVE